MAEKGAESCAWGQERRKRERGRRKEMRGGQGPLFLRKHGECSQEVLLVAAAEEIACEDPRGRPVQMPEC